MGGDYLGTRNEAVPVSIALYGGADFFVGCPFFCQANIVR